MEFIDDSLESEGPYGDAGNQNAIISAPLPVFAIITGLKVTESNCSFLLSLTSIKLGRCWLPIIFLHLIFLFTCHTFSPSLTLSALLVTELLKTHYIVPVHCQYVADR